MHSLNNRWWHKIIIPILVIAIVAPSVYLLTPTQKAEAQGSCIGGIIAYGIGAIMGIVGSIMSVPTHDTPTFAQATGINANTWGTFIKECIIMPLVKALIKTLIHNFLMSIVDWINTGFEGSGPRFVTDPAGFFADVADQAVGQAVLGSDLSWLCSPFAADIKLHLGLSYWNRRRDQIKCTLSGIMNNVGAAGNSLQNNGWQGWLDVTTVPQNNFYGSSLLARNEIDVKIGRNNYTLGKETDWAGGFLSTKKCVNGDFYDNVSGKTLDPNTATDEQMASALYDCTQYQTVTPGTTIKDQLSHTLGSQVDDLINSEDIDAIFGALFNQMVNQVFTSTGLFQTPGSNVGKAYRQQFYNNLATAKNKQPPVSCEEFQKNYTLVGNEIMKYTPATPTTPGGSWEPANIPGDAAENFQSFTNYCTQKPFSDSVQNSAKDVSDTTGRIFGTFSDFSSGQSAAKLSLYQALATQSCDYKQGYGNNGPAKLALDGALQTQSAVWDCVWDHDPGSGTTLGNQNPWWKVPLPKAEILESVVIQPNTTSSDEGIINAFGLKPYNGGPAQVILYSLDTDGNEVTQKTFDIPFVPGKSDYIGQESFIVSLRDGSGPYIHELDSEGHPVPNITGVKIQSGGVGLSLLEVSIYRHLPPVVDKGSLAVIPSNLEDGTDFTPLVEGIKATYYKTAGTNPSFAVSYNREELSANMIIEISYIDAASGSKKTLSPATTYNLSIGNYTITYSIKDPIDQSIISEPVTRDITVLGASAIGGGDSGNSPPIVNAGSDDAINLPTNNVTLNGSVTDDGQPSGSVLSFSWSVAGGPYGVTFSNPNELKPVVTFPTSGTYLLRLSANDGNLSAFDDVLINVGSAGSTNQPPVINSITGPQNVSLSGGGGVQVSFNASATDPEGSALNYRWFLLSSPAGSTVNFNTSTQSTPSTSATFSSAGSYLIRLNVSDSLGAAAVTDVSVTVTSSLPPLTAACTINGSTGKVTINSGDSVTRTALPGGGSGSYTYSWFDFDPALSSSLVGNGSTYSRSYNVSTTATAPSVSVVVSDGSSSKTASCPEVTINQK